MARKISILLLAFLCNACISDKSQDCEKNTHHKQTDLQAQEEFYFDEKPNQPIPDSINNLFPKRQLDNFIIDRCIIDTLGYKILFSTYEIFNTGVKGYPKVTFIHTYEFPDKAISFGTDGEFNKIFINTDKTFDIISLAPDSNLPIYQNGRNGLGQILSKIKKSRKLPKAEYEYDVVIDSIRSKSWVSHFRKEKYPNGIALKNADGYDFTFGFSAGISRKDKTKAEFDSLVQEGIKTFPPFLFTDWKSYAVPFYRYGYAPVYYN